MASVCGCPNWLPSPAVSTTADGFTCSIQGSPPTIPGNDGPALRAIRPCVVVRVLRVKIGHAAGVGTSLRPYHRLEVSCGVH